MCKNATIIQPISDREQVLLDALQQIMRDGHKQPENLHEEQMKRYSAGATKIATDALTTYIEIIDRQKADAEAHLAACKEAAEARANGELQ